MGEQELARDCEMATDYFELAEEPKKSAKAKQEHPLDAAMSSSFSLEWHNSDR
jgi:hypothetical protein